MTTEQKATVKRLIRLGDSPRLAIKTVKAIPLPCKETFEAYRHAYRS